MSIFRAAVGNDLVEFLDDAGLQDVWRFISSHMTDALSDRAIVLVADDGESVGFIWDSSLFYAHWETAAKMRAHLDLIGFDLAGGVS